MYILESDVFIIWDYYCKKSFKDGLVRYNHFFQSPSQVKLCGASDSDIVYVSLRKAEDGEQEDLWGFHYFDKGAVDFIFQTKKHVQVCSNDFFKRSVLTGVGDFIRLVVID